MGQHVQSMVVWASGMIEFVDAQSEPEGSILVCVAHGDDAVEKLAELIVDRADLWHFDEQLALKVPGIDPHRPDPGSAFDAAIDTLIDWENQLRNDIGFDPRFVWGRG